MDFELSRWGDGQIHLCHEDSLGGEDIDIVLDCIPPCANGKQVDVCCFLRSLIVDLEVRARADQIGKGAGRK